MSIRGQFLSGLKWTVFGRIATQVVTWAVTIYVMRLLDTADYGLMALAAIFSALLTMLAEMGLGSALVRTRNLTPYQIRQVFGIVLLTNLGVCVLMAGAIAPLAALFFGDARLEPVIQVIALHFIPAAFAVIPASQLARDMKFRGRAIADFSSSVGGAFIVLALAYQGYGVFSLAWGSIAQATIRAIALNIARPYAFAPIFRFAGCGSMFSFGGNVAATQLVWYFYSQADALLIGRMLGKHDLGVYSVSMELASLPASRASQILNQIVFPTLSSIQRDGSSIGPYLMKGLRGVSLLSFPVMWGISSIAPELVMGLLGEKWREAITPLAILCLIMPLRVLSPLLHNGLYAVGRADMSFQITCVTAVTMLTAFLVGIQFGVIGVSLAWLIGFPTVFLFNLLRSGRHMDLSAREMAAALIPPAVACGLMYGTVSLVRPTLKWSAPANLAALILVGAAVYSVFTLIFNRRGLAEARALLGSRSD
ncbi:lipopolysaccharide biosynthesis protein [Accumulibacter sp.]|uniref:lipopolysaccharide biosynthesis protein n=1 Tax=Accumulibacter sp. TaxID=2053492 RepID=UPI00258F0D1E|nr:lipopolysaccharide biosynthesis protein [Accumulibacter sp.]